MAENTTVKSAAQTAALVDDNTQNPDAVSTPALVARDKRVVHITLEIEGVAITPDQIYDAIDLIGETITLGTGGSTTDNVKVKTNRDQLARGCYIFNIGPA